MDKKRALRILGLGPAATQKEARKAFRSLAKACHPDRFARDPVGAKTAETRMKEINLAFHFLLPSLAVASPEPVPPQVNRAAKGPGFFSAVREKWKKRPRPKSDPAASKVTAQKPKRPVPVKPAFRKAGSPSFETFLNSLDQLDPNEKTVTRSTRKAGESYENYCRYLAAGKKIRGTRIRSKNMEIGRVEKISPVQRVNPIGGE